MAAWNLAHPTATITDTENHAARKPKRYIKYSM